MNEFMYGCVGGIFGTIVSHPIDTIRINLQSSKIPNYSFLSLYKGILTPVLGIGVEKAIVFGTYNLTKNMLPNTTRDTIMGDFISGVNAGLSSTLVVTPVEYFKIIYQNNSRIKFKQLCIKEMYRGWTATLFRETPGYGIYFATYNKLTETFGKNPCTIFISGGLAGLNAWVFIYPADYIKTRMQYFKTPFRETAKGILKDGVLAMYKGCTLALVRAFVLHCGVFTAYEFIKKVISN
tara:strand:- start:67 stop:777 length:711 start_codon:yes stop_codon:yes gene_type:complete